MEVWIWWLIIAVILVVVEALTTNIVCIWFIVSSLISLILSLFVDSVMVQIGVFVLVGVLLLILTKPIINKYLKKELEKTNIDRIIGMTGIVTNDILKNYIGEVKVDGKCWSAISKQELKKGETVKVLKIEGVKIIVERSED